MKSRFTILIGLILIISNVFGGIIEKSSNSTGSNNNAASCYVLSNQPKSLFGEYGNYLTTNLGSTNSSMMLPNVCCPQFILKDAIDICPPEGACVHTNGTAGNPAPAAKLAVCKNLAHKYTVYPNDPTFTYTWTVTGGTPSSTSGNPITIVWGNGNSGTIKVVTSNLGSMGTCKDSIERDVCLIDGPKANFSKSKDTICTSQSVTFTNTSLGGSVYHWDFGDGITSNLANPLPHTYALPGTYTVVLTAIDMGSGTLVPTTQGETLVPCGCRDTIAKTVVVLSGSGPTITFDCCFGTVCAGDTSSLCTSMICGTYNWSVTGGTIISGLNTSCIKVKWFSVYSVPTTVTLQSCPSSACAGATTINVPVLYPNLPISGPTIVCVGASGSYSLPRLPGTYYKWTVSGGLYSFNQVDRNSPDVNITFTTPGPFWVKCVYNNPLKGCSGADSVLVNVLPTFSIGGDKIVCEGNPVWYYANGAANWTITPAGGTIITGNGTASMQAFFSPGTYTITATPVNPAAFCNANAVMKVEAVAKPILNSIVGSAFACPGTKLSYSISSNLAGSPFVWSITGGTGNVLSQYGDDNDTAIVEFTGFGPWIINVYQDHEISPGVFCPSLTQSLLVNPYAAPVISGPNVLCGNSTGTYSAGGSTPPGGFQWSISPSYQGSILNQGGNPVNILWHGPSNTDTLSVSSCAGNDVFPVTINAPPTPIASYNTLPIFCQGVSQTLILSTPVGAGFSYQWYKNNNPVGGGINPTLNVSIAPLAVGTYQFYVVVTKNGCSGKSNLINVRIDNCTPGNPGGGPLPGGCDALAFFKTYVVCGNITLQNLSTVLAPNVITNYSWSISGPGIGTFLPNANVATPTLSVNASGNYTITLTVTSSSGCTTTWTEIVTVFLPTASFTYPSPVCVNSTVTFTASPNLPSLNYGWMFGDLATTYFGPGANAQHVYSSVSPPPFNVKLMIVDPYGCTATIIQPITVNPLPSCTISASDTIFCPGGFVTLSACTGMTSYQWYKDGNLITGATSSTYNVTSVGEYWVQVTNGCTNISNKIFIYKHPKPKAKITGDRYTCAPAGSSNSVNLTTILDANYQYSWSSNAPGTTTTTSKASRDCSTCCVTVTTCRPGRSGHG